MNADEIGAEFGISFSVSENLFAILASELASCGQQGCQTELPDGLLSNQKSQFG
jgi:hypothetical protein